MRLSYLVFVAVTLWFGCSSPDKGADCAADEQVVCACEFGEGYRPCGADGPFGPCHCPNDVQMPGNVADAGFDTSPDQAATVPLISGPQQVVFERIPIVDDTTRNQHWKLIRIENLGDGPLLLDEFVFSPSASDFSASFPLGESPDADPPSDSSDFPMAVAPGSSFPIRVYFNPAASGASSADLTISSNDPASPELVISLLGNHDLPCIDLGLPGGVEFGATNPGTTKSRTVTIENCSRTSELVVDAITVCTLIDAACQTTSPVFGIRDGSFGVGTGLHATIPPMGEETFLVDFTPSELRSYVGELSVSSNAAGNSPLVLPILGRGDDEVCPLARAEAKLSDGTRWATDITTIPLKTVQFNALNSVNVGGPIDRYGWTVVRQPNGSTARMSPSAGVAEPSLFLDLAGDYVIELKVYDDNGTESCGDQALITIRATPDEDVYVQLVWDTPTDANQTDAFGTDIDLHVLHPNGSWNSAPYDIYWLNPTADWGTPGPSDDPSLDIDDTDGAGPESVNIRDPQAGLSFAVGAYYYADNGYGPSYATIRIYIRGTQAYEYRDMLLPSMGSFWYAATISWPTGAVAGINNVRQGFPGSP